MQIVHFLLGRCNPDGANGVEKMVYFLSKAHARLGHELSLFSLTPGEPIFIGGVQE